MLRALGSCNATLGRRVDMTVPICTPYCAIKNASQNVADECAGKDPKNPRGAITRPVDHLTSAPEIARGRHEQGRRHEHTDDRAEGDNQGAEHLRFRSSSHPSRGDLTQ